MTLPVSPLAISLANLQTEFGGSNPISLNEYYAGGSYVVAGTNGFPSAVSTAIPSSGQISLSNFHGAVVSYSLTISSNTQNYNLRTALLAAGYSGSGAFSVTVTINSGVYVWSNSTSLAAFDTGSLTGGTINIINNGFIMGKGGVGGTATNGTGASGGPAMSINQNVTINHTSGTGYIGGGGGGGGSGAAGGGGGAGGGTGGSASGSSGGAGGSLGGTGGNGGGYGSTGGSGGSAGGGGGSWDLKNAPNGSGGGGGRVFPGVGGAGASRPSGTSNTLGGTGGSAGNAGGNGEAAGPGGGGGGWGAAGGTGGNGTGAAISGGSGGKAINTNGNTVTWTSGNSSRVYGAVA